VLVSGGLGPTEDDLTVDVVAALTGAEPQVHEPSLEKMKARFAKAAFRLTPNNVRQVRVPSGAGVFLNPTGLAPGFEVQISGTPIFCMPGVPRELHAIFDTAVEARMIDLREAGGEAVERLAKQIYRVFGMGESHIATALSGVVDDVEGASLHYQVKFPETLVKVVVRSRDQGEASARLEAIGEQVRSRLGDKLYGTGDDTLAAVLGERLRAAGATVATAESCTGGLIGGLITGVPGSSDYYPGGTVVYSNEQKTRQLGVRASILDAHGAVSRECVLQMAHGARERFGTDYAVAVSGVAGPGGGTEDKPVGLVWLATVGPDGAEYAREFRWPGARDQVRQLAAHAALGMLLRMVSQ
jgi:nicotinamide-nucleotide amidase